MPLLLAIIIAVLFFGVLIAVDFWLDRPVEDDYRG